MPLEKAQASNDPFADLGSLGTALNTSNNSNVGGNLPNTNVGPTPTTTAFANSGPTSTNANTFGSVGPSPLATPRASPAHTPSHRAHTPQQADYR